jgi:hypothetical protein
MDSDDHLAVPELAGLSPTRIGASAGVAGVVGIFALLLFGASHVLPASTNLRPPPSRAEELSGNVVTTIPYDDPIGLFLHEPLALSHQVSSAKRLLRRRVFTTLGRVD